MVCGQVHSLFPVMALATRSTHGVWSGSFTGEQWWAWLRGQLIPTVCGQGHSLFPVMALATRTTHGVWSGSVTGDPIVTKSHSPSQAHYRTYSTPPCLQHTKVLTAHHRAYSTPLCL
jgi:hypothetical protein